MSLFEGSEGVVPGADSKGLCEMVQPSRAFWMGLSFPEGVGRLLGEL